MPKKCIQCKGEIKFKYTSLQKTCSISCQLQWNHDHPQEVKNYVQLLAEKEAKKEARKWKTEKKTRKEKLKTLTQHESDAKKVFQRWIRMRDKDRTCISCDTNNSPIWDAGHWWKAELYSGLIFDQDNVHKQCRRCNWFLGGNETNYRLGLIARYGAEFVARIEERKDRLREYKFTKEELIRIKETYTLKLKEG